ncbi:hypothetical protein GW17_00036682 [Ensete ventricosum]|nr:hypothetical protein GW17_00036682 [Ensete ventricosum]RZS09572.1 hypothetical protein BHM03_00040668 [Ensete ventricosum]
MGQVLDGKSNQSRMHFSWNLCLHCGSSHSFSLATKSSKQMTQLSRYDHNDVETRKCSSFVSMSMLWLLGAVASPWVTLFRQTGQVIDGASTHRSMHTPWNKCLHRGSTHSSSPLTNSSMQMMQLSTSGSGTTAETGGDGGGGEDEGTTYKARGILVSKAATTNLFRCLSQHRHTALTKNTIVTKIA